MSRTIAGLALALAAAGCGGGGKSGPCTGTSCLQVAGTYAVSAQRSPQSSCASIVMGGEDSSGHADRTLTVTQSGADLTLTRGSVNLHGTLQSSGQASFKTHLDHVDLGNCSSQCDYQIDVDFELIFSGTGGNAQFTGTETDTLNANQTQVGIGQGDQHCLLAETLTAKLAR